MSGRFNGKRGYGSDRPRQDQRHYHNNQQGSWGNQRDRYQDEHPYHNDHRPHQHDQRNQRDQSHRNQQQWGHGQSQSQSQLNSFIPRRGPSSFERSPQQQRNNRTSNNFNPSPFSAGNNFTPKSMHNVRNRRPPAGRKVANNRHLSKSLKDLDIVIGGYTVKQWEVMSLADTLAKFDALSREQQLDLFLPKNKEGLADYPTQMYPWNWSSRLENAAQVVQDSIDKEFNELQIEEDAARAQTHFIQMLTRCPLMTMGFNVTNFCPLEDETNCYCPCSNNGSIKRWKAVFGLNVKHLFGAESTKASIEACDLQVRTPNEFMPHLRDKGDNGSRLHTLTYQFLITLYSNHYGRGIDHMGIHAVESPEYKAAKTAKTKIIQEQQRLLREKSDKGQQYKEELDRIKKEKKALEQVNQDLYKKLERRNKILARLKKPVVGKKCINQSKTTCTNALNLFSRFCGPESVSKGARIILKIQPEDTLNETFRKWSKERKKNELFVEKLSPSQISKFFRPLNVKYGADSQLKVKKEKEKKTDIIAKDAGGPARQFLSTLWRGLGDLEVVKTFKDFERDANGKERTTEYKFKLFEAAELGFVPLPDDIIQDLLKKAKHDLNDIVMTVRSYYRAVGRCMAHSLLSMHGQLDTNKDAENSKSAHSCVIDGQALPSLFRSYLFRGVSPDNESYETHDFMSHIMDIVMTVKLEETGEHMEKLLFDRILPLVELKPEDDKWKVARREMTERYIEGRSIALGALYDGLSLGGTIDPKVCFPESCPPAALNVIMFSASSVTIDDFLEKDGSHRILQRRPAASDLEGMDAAAIEIYYERYQTLMTDLATLLRNQDESFLSNFLFHCTGQYYVPNVDIHQDFKIHVELSLGVPTDGLPIVHTCTKDLLFPHNAYDNDTEKLEEKLKQSMGYSAGKWSMV